jgi:putative membrane protein
MIDDHGKARDMLLNVAKAMKLSVVERPSPTKREHMERLSKLAGVDFDREYVRHMVENHEKSLTMHEKWAREAGNEGLRDYARMTVPTVKDHLEHARRLAAR